jgi:malate synthase
MAADRARYTHDIGNLVLTAYNPSLGAKGFSAKKGTAGQARCYATSQLKSEQRLAALPQWDVATLKARRAEIVAWAKDRWALAEPPAASVEVVPDDEEDTL